MNKTIISTGNDFYVTEVKETKADIIHQEAKSDVSPAPKKNPHG